MSLPADTGAMHLAGIRAARACDEAAYVRLVEDMGVVFVWNGAHTVNVFDAWDWNALDAFTVGDMGRPQATKHQVEAGISGWLRP